MDGMSTDQNPNRYAFGDPINYVDDSGFDGNDNYKNDIPFLACATQFNCPIWTDDTDFDKQNKIKVLKTKDMLETIN